ncbi:MAG: ABC transporter substrate binding protein [Bryobacteraceae bacterium]
MEFEYQNASGDLSTARAIAEKFLNGRISLIFSIATPMSQAVQRAAEGKNLPIIFGAITDPVSAGLVQSMERRGGYITGTSDR